VAAGTLQQQLRLRMLLLWPWQQPRPALLPLLVLR
jgi:hypothetical protein